MIDRCVACGSEALAVEPSWHGYELRRCEDCGLSQTANPDYAREKYVAAYAGNADESVLPAEHAFIYRAPERRLELELEAAWVPPPRVTPTERAALDWIGARIPDDALVVDCGAGTGRFLRLLRRRGLRGAGFELSAQMVELVRRAGFDIEVGGAPDFPWARDEEPWAITFFEVLEHLPEPETFLAPLRERFPEAHVLATVPSPRRVAVLKGERRPVDYPPNHYLRWTPDALERFFRRIGYGSVDVVLPAPSGAEVMPGFTQVASRLRRSAAEATGASTSAIASRRPSRATATAAVAVARAYQAAAELAGARAARRWERRGATSSSMLVIASP